MYIDMYIDMYVCMYVGRYVYRYVCITVLLSILFSSCATFEYHTLARVVAQHGPLRHCVFSFPSLVCPCHAAKRIEKIFHPR